MGLAWNIRPIANCRSHYFRLCSVFTKTWFQENFSYKQASFPGFSVL